MHLLLAREQFIHACPYDAGRPTDSWLSGVDAIMLPQPCRRHGWHSPEIESPIGQDYTDCTVPLVSMDGCKGRDKMTGADGDGVECRLLSGIAVLISFLKHGRRGMEMAQCVVTLQTEFRPGGGYCKHAMHHPMYLQ